MAKYIVTVADLTDSTPFEVLYGEDQVVFDDATEAQDQVDRFNADAIWGKNGDLMPEDVGFSYVVREVDPDGEFEAWGLQG